MPCLASASRRAHHLALEGLGLGLVASGEVVDLRADEPALHVFVEVLVATEPPSQVATVAAMSGPAVGVTPFLFLPAACAAGVGSLGVAAEEEAAASGNVRRMGDSGAWVRRLNRSEAAGSR